MVEESRSHSGSSSTHMSPKNAQHTELLPNQKQFSHLVTQKDANIQNNEGQESILHSEFDDHFSKCHESELQDGVFTELGHAADEFKQRAINSGERLRDSMIDLHTNMRLEASEQTEKAKRKYSKAKEKIISNIDEFSENARIKVKRVRKSIKEFIGTKKELNDSGVFEGDYDYIESGYRVNHTSYTSLAKSLFTWHNESVNVWSHLFGVLLFSILCVILLVWFEPRQLSFGYEIIDTIENSATTININDYLTSQIIRVQTETFNLANLDLSAEGAED